MARRRRSYRKKSGVYATPGSWSPSVAGGTRESVLMAAEIFATKARSIAAKFSTRIPAATHVEPLNEQTATVVTDGKAAPNAAPFEFGERHPLWGRWVTGKGKQPTRAYMNRTANDSATLDEAADVYANVETILLSAEHGYDE
jgi:hypothetical protein